LQIQKVQFKNFRSLTDDIVFPGHGTNVIWGDNAQGKTNFLELIWMFSGNRSFRGSKDEEFIRFGERTSEIEAVFYSEDREQTAQITYYNDASVKIKKEIKINDIKKRASSSLTEKFNMIVFSPEHLYLVKGSAEKRRKFLDDALCNWKTSLDNLFTQYNKTLVQRNALLKDIYKHNELKATVPIWDENLSHLGSMVIRQRILYLEYLSKFASLYHLGISDNKEALTLDYHSDIKIQRTDSCEEIKQKLLTSLTENRNIDYKLGITGIGPHRDDIDICINGKSVRKYGSQGQQRSVVLSLKLAEASVLKEKSGEMPIILLDDVLSELDIKRQNFLLKKINNYQVFISSCEKTTKNRADETKLFYICKGTISEESVNNNNR